MLNLKPIPTTPSGSNVLPKNPLLYLSKVIAMFLSDKFIAGLCFFLLWGWFISPLGVFALTYLQSVGIVFLVKLITSVSTYDDDDFQNLLKKDPEEGLRISFGVWKHQQAQYAPFVLWGFLLQFFL